MRRFVGIILLFLGVLIAGPIRAGPEPRERTSWAVPDEAFSALFSRWNDRWIGGDLTASIPLPDGRTVWLLGDTLLKGPEGRSGGITLLHNTLIIQQGHEGDLLHGGTRKCPRALVESASMEEWYWPGDGTVEHGLLRLFFFRFRRMGPARWNFNQMGIYIASMTLPEMDLQEDLFPIPHRNVLWGAVLLEATPWIYVYGVEDLQTRKFVHLARSPVGRLQGPWTFWTGSGWSPDPSGSIRMLEGISNRFSVIPWREKFCLITLDSRVPFSRTLVGYYAPAPWGPWEGPFPLHRISLEKDDLVVYNALAHPQFTRGDRVLISHNVNILGGIKELLHRGPQLYRPRFLRLRMGWAEAKPRQGSRICPFMKSTP